MSQFDAIVIGSGMGGLTTASLLARLKKNRVLVLERHFRAGGFTHTFKRPGGYRWDVGLHYVGELGPGSRSRMLMDFVTGDIPWNPLPNVYDRFIYPQITFDVPTGMANYRTALIQQFPAESPAITQYFRDLKTAVRFVTRHIVANCLPPLLASGLRAFNGLNSRLPLMTTAQYLDGHFESPLLKALLVSQWMDYGLPPSKSAFATHALIANHYLEGAWYPQGGAGVIAEGAQKIIEQADGKVLVNHAVSNVLLEDGKVVGVEARVTNKAASAPLLFHAPIVVSDAGAWNTFQHLLPSNLRLLIRSEISQAGFAAVTLYLGLNRDPRSLGFQGENYWIFEGLDHDQMAADQDEILSGEPRGCYLSFPSLKERDAKAHTAEIIAPLSYATLEQFRDEPWRNRSAEYQQSKARISAALLALVERRFPGFSQLVAFSELSTPLTVEHFTQHPQGAIYGSPATPDRYRRSWLKPDTPMPGLYLTGADAGSLGIIGAMMGGVAAASRILGPFGLFAIMAAATRNMHQKNSTAPPQPPKT